MFSSLYSDLRNSRKAICPAGNHRWESAGHSVREREREVGIKKRLSPLHPRTLSTDSFHVSTSSRGSLGKQHNLPLKRASRSITSPVICDLTHSPEDLTGRPDHQSFKVCNVLCLEMTYKYLTQCTQHLRLPVITGPLSKLNTQCKVRLTACANQLGIFHMVKAQQSNMK